MGGVLSPASSEVWNQLRQGVESPVPAWVHQSGFSRKAACLRLIAAALKESVSSFRCFCAFLKIDFLAPGLSSGVQIAIQTVAVAG